jgi:hypothetical protein
VANGHFVERLVANVPMFEVSYRYRNNVIQSLCYFNSSDPAVRVPLVRDFNHTKGLKKLGTWLYFPIMYVIRGTE